jgi:allantoinase
VTDLVIHGATVVTSTSLGLADIAVTDGRISAVGTNLDLDASVRIDASGLHVFPGGIDSHVHFNEPGRTEWETIANGSAALAAGGYTTFIDMPLNNLPVTTDGPAFDLKLTAAKRSSLIDFGFWAGLVPGNLGHLETLHARGALGFKAFMCPSGIDEFPACDEKTLRDGMKRIAELDSILLVHAEAPELLQPLSGPGWKDFVLSRPPEAEWTAIGQAVGLAAETGCRLHVVHVSTPHGFEMISEAQEHGVDVSGESCPHYLLYADSDLEWLGGIGKCAPPLRSRQFRDGLRRMLVHGQIPMVVSDHSPSTLDLKSGSDFSAIWGGISGCQSTRPLLLAHEGLDLQLLAGLTSMNVARRFRLKGKGDITSGFDADLWIVDLGHTDVVRSEDLLYHNPFSPHEGQPVRGRTVRTLVRGKTVFAPGQAQPGSAGRLVTPTV